MHHEKLKGATAQRRVYCGPAALVLLSGRDPLDIYRRVWDGRGNPICAAKNQFVRLMQTSEVTALLSSWGKSVVRVGIWPEAASRPTLAQALKLPTLKEAGEYLVALSSHFVVIGVSEYGYQSLADNRNPGGGPASKAKHRRSRVCGIYRVS